MKNKIIYKNRILLFIHKTNIIVGSEIYRCFIRKSIPEHKSKSFKKNIYKTKLYKNISTTVLNLKILEYQCLFQ